MKFAFICGIATELHDYNYDHNPCSDENKWHKRIADEITHTCCNWLHKAVPDDADGRSLIHELDEIVKWCGLLCYVRQSRLLEPFDS